VSANKCADLAGNLNLASTNTHNSVVYGTDALACPVSRLVTAAHSPS
jgi:hypothetical protein